MSTHSSVVDWQRKLGHSCKTPTKTLCEESERRNKIDGWSHGLPTPRVTLGEGCVAGTDELGLSRGM